MKKNISINISGIIFHIEEDGYEILRKYLDSINRYFSSFEDNSEILADIESRIAEILLSKLSEGKQVVTAEDVNALMATMGSVNDFKAAEEQEANGSSSAYEQRSQQQSSSSSTAADQNLRNRKLFRDTKRKVLGGVCAGLGHYFGLDPVWPRVLFALLTFVTYGGLLIAYFILWIIIPPSDELEDEASVKKMYRDPDKRVIGGVASGLAAFWGIDSIIVRVLFVCATIFGGLGLLVYIIMWIALPEAKTITEKMQMSGEPVTLSNIESSVKRAINEKDGAEESVFARIVLFPFRLIAMLIDALAKILGPAFMLIVDILRIAIGLCITLTGALLIFSLVVAFSVVFGLFTIPVDSTWNDIYVSSPRIPLDIMRSTFPNWIAIFAFIAAFVPAFMMALLGASIIGKRIVFNSYVGWSMFVLFFVSVGVLAYTVPQIIYSFKEDGEYKTEQAYEIKGTPTLRINQVGLEDYNVTDLTIRPHDGKDLKLVQRFEAQGPNRKTAGENAQMVEYKVVQVDSVLTFDSNITFKKDAKFRAQRLDMELYVATNRPFILDEGMWRLVDNSLDDGQWYYRDRDDKQTWKLNDRGVLECITCAKSERYDRGFSSDNDPDDSADDNDGDDNTSSRSNSERIVVDQFGLHDFNSVDASGLFDITIDQGDEYAVQLDGSDAEKKRYKIYTTGETLVVDYDDKSDNFWKRRSLEGHQIQMKITMPHLRELEASGGGKIRFRGFEEDNVRIKITGAVQANGGIDAGELKVNITGASTLDLNGTGTYLDADITGASALSAYGYQVERANVEAHGASSAKVYVTEELEISKGMASSVSHRGDPKVLKDN